MSIPVSGDAAHIGKSVSIRGDISGNEDIYLDGQIEGSIQLSTNSLTVGPNGRIRANISAKNVTVSGSIEGNIQVGERTEMRKTAIVSGDVQTRRIAIEEGAYFKGKLEILAESRPESSAGAARAAASAGTSSSSTRASEHNK
jgi:cytoskeletal protein CcmA (bactofilin family)